MVEENQTLAIAYRVYPKFSPGAQREQFAYKFDMFSKCLSSMVEALRGVDYHIFFLLDSCPEEYGNYIRDNVEKGRFNIESVNHCGNRNTFLRQMEILRDQDFSDNVYFAEDDYLYTGKSLEPLISMIEGGEADFVSPYNHPDYYPETSCAPHFLHKYRWYAAEKHGKLFLQVGSTTMTFLTTRKVLRESWNILQWYKKSGITDYEMWLLLTKMRRVSTTIRKTARLYAAYMSIIKLHRRFRLYIPIPGVAVHMATPYFGKEEVVSQISSLLVYEARNATHKWSEGYRIVLSRPSVLSSRRVNRSGMNAGEAARMEGYS